MHWHSAWTMQPQTIPLPEMVPQWFHSVPNSPIQRQRRNTKTPCLARGSFVEPPRGFEPRTYALRVRCSTTELRRRAHEEPAHVTGRPDLPLLADQISRRERAAEQKGVDRCVNALRALVVGGVVVAIPSEKTGITQLVGHSLSPLIRGRWIMLGRNYEHRRGTVRGNNGGLFGGSCRPVSAAQQSPSLSFAKCWCGYRPLFSELLDFFHATIEGMIQASNRVERFN